MLVTDHFRDDLLARLDIVEVIDRRIKLKRQGKNYGACCPFHDEKTPSFSVEPTKQFYYCFGCGAGGDAIGFVIAYESISYRHAVNPMTGGVFPLPVWSASATREMIVDDSEGDGE